MKRIFLIASLYALTAMTAQAEVNVDRLVASYQAEGYTSIEVTKGRTQTKVEAIKGDVKIEVIYDTATGQILKNETDSAAGEFMRPGVKLRERDRDFVRVTGSDDDSEGSGDDDGEDDDRDDDENDDDSNDDNGSDDDEGDDSNDDNGGDESDDDSNDDDNDDGGSDDDSNDEGDDDSGSDDESDDSDDNSGSDDENDD